MLRKQYEIPSVRVIKFSAEAMQDMEQIVKLSRDILTAPFTEEQCEILLNTIVDMQFSYSDDISDFEDVLRATIDYLELLKARLDNNNFTPNPF